MASTKDYLEFTDDYGKRHVVQNLDTKRARRYVDILGCSRRACCCGQICYHPDGAEEMTEKQLLAFIKTIS